MCIRDRLLAADRPSSLLGFDLRTAPEACRPKRFIILRCNSDDLTLVSDMRDWWVVNSAGILHRPEWPFPTGTYDGSFFLKSPKIKFSTDENRIRYGLTLGSNWYNVIDAELQGFAT